MAEYSDIPPAFIADTMLGRLSRWLSLLGYDIEYAGMIDDDELIRLARDSGRIILTRDTGIVRNPQGAGVILISSTDHWEQLREVVTRVPLDFPRTAFSRCSRCNALIVPVDKERVGADLPPLVCQTQEVFFQCPSCGKVYWEASHVDHIRVMMKNHLGIDLGKWPYGG